MRRRPIGSRRSRHHRPTSWRRWRYEPETWTGEVGGIWGTRYPYSLSLTQWSRPNSERVYPLFSSPVFPRVPPFPCLQRAATISQSLPESTWGDSGRRKLSYDNAYMERV